MRQMYGSIYSCERGNRRMAEIGGGMGIGKVAGKRESEGRHGEGRRETKGLRNVEIKRHRKKGVPLPINTNIKAIWQR